MITKKSTFFIVVLIFLCMNSIVLAQVNFIARPFVGNDPQTNTTFNYTMTFCADIDCATAYANISTQISTDSKGIGFNILKLSGLVTTPPSFIKRYRDGVIESTLNVSTTFHKNVLATDNGTFMDRLNVGGTTSTHTLTVNGDVNISNGIFTNYSSCSTTLETNELGMVVCGTDDTGGAGSFDASNYVNKTNNHTISGNNTFTSITELYDVIIHQFSRLIDFGNLTGVPDYNATLILTESQISDLSHTVDTDTIFDNTGVVNISNAQTITSIKTFTAEQDFTTGIKINHSQTGSCLLSLDSNNRTFCNTTIKDNIDTDTDTIFDNTGYTNVSQDFQIEGTWDFRNQVNLSSGVGINITTCGAIGVAGGRLFCNTTIKDNIDTNTQNNFWTSAGALLYNLTASIGIGTATPTHELNVVGSVNVTVEQIIGKMYINTTHQCTDYPTNSHCRFSNSTHEIQT